MAIKLRNGQLDDIDTPGRLQHAHYSVKYSNCAAEPLRDMANSDRTNLLVDLIGMWRAMASKLSIEERRQISNLDNFALPCRAYIITCKEPQLTLLFVARLADSDVIEDLGEHDLSELPRVVDEFRQRCDWQHAQYHDPRSSLFPRMGLGRSSASAVEVMLLGWLRQLRHPRPTGTQTQVSSKSAVGTEGSFCWYVSGNPLKLAVQQVVDQIASEATRPKLPAQNAAAAVPEAEIDGFTTSFYPAVFVAEAEWPSFFSDAANRIREELDEVVIKVPLETSFITVTRDGEIVTGISDARRALRLLNVLFALVRLKAGCPVHSVPIRALEGKDRSDHVPNEVIRGRHGKPPDRVLA